MLSSSLGIVSGLLYHAVDIGNLLSLIWREALEALEALFASAFSASLGDTSQELTSALVPTHIQARELSPKSFPWIDELRQWT